MDTSEIYAKMCDCEEVQGKWEPVQGDWFFTSCSSLSYAYGGMRDGGTYGDKEYKPVLPNLKTGRVELLTEQPVDSGYYGWCIGESFPDGDKQRDMLKYFIWLPRQDQIQEMMGKNVKNSKILVRGFSCQAWKFCKMSDYKPKSFEQLWLTFYMHEYHNLKWEDTKWSKTSKPKR